MNDLELKQNNATTLWHWYYREFFTTLSTMTRQSAL